MPCCLLMHPRYGDSPRLTCPGYRSGTHRGLFKLWSLNVDARLLRRDGWPAESVVRVIVLVVLCIRVDDHTSSEQQPPPAGDPPPACLPQRRVKARPRSFACTISDAPKVVQNSQDHDP